jgi:hypothetical protein
MNNSKFHNSSLASHKIHELQLIRLPQLLDSPDIAPCDFAVFPWNEAKLKGFAFHGQAKLLQTLQDQWQEIDCN